MYSEEPYLIKFLSRFKKITNESKILELGSGPHGVSFFHSKGIRIALDPLATFYYREFSFYQKGKGARIVEGRGENLPFSDQTFDFVISDNVLDHTENPDRILAEIRRVLASDGLLLLTVHVHHWAYSAVNSLFNLFLSIKIAFNFPNFRTHPYFFTPKALERRILKNDFKICYKDIPPYQKNRSKQSKGLIPFRPFNHLLSKFICARFLHD